MNRDIDIKINGDIDKRKDRKKKYIYKYQCKYQRQCTNKKKLKK